MGEINGLWTVIAGALGVLAAPLLAFWAARRTASGRIATSDATDLWAEGQKIREFLGTQVSELRGELNKVRDEAREEINRLEGLLVEKELEIVKLTTMIAERDSRITRLERLLESHGGV